MKTVPGKNGGKILQSEKGETSNPNGRPRKFVTLLKDEGYTKAEVMATYAVMLSRSLDELKAIYGNVQATVLERTVANAIRKDLEKGDLKNIELILTRTHGAPKQEVQQSTEMTFVWQETKTYDSDQKTDGSH